MGRLPTENIDYTSRDYEAFRDLMISKLREVMPEYTDTSETDAGIVIIEALANGLDILSLYSDIIANDIILPTTQDRKLAVILSECLGYTPYTQTSSKYRQVFVLEVKSDKDTLIPKGTIVKTKESSDLATLYFETMEDLIIPAGALGDEKDNDENYLYTVPIQHGTSIKQDVMGSSTGASLQVYKLTYTGVLVDSIDLYVTEGNSKTLWRRVDNFIDCDETSRVYKATVDDFDVCTIEFGNNLRGKIPEKNSIISADYRVGGGAVSVVSANIITEVETNIPYVKSTFNLEAFERGHNKESLESIKENAPASFRTRDRLVTLQDYSDLLRINFYDFLCLKTVRDDTNRKLAHIYYMMKVGYELTGDLIEEIAEFISRRSMVGTEYDLNPYVAQPVNLDCKMYVDSDYNADELKRNAESYIRDVIFRYGDLKFEDSLIKSDIESEVKSTFTGILSFRINTPQSDIIAPTDPQNVLTLGTLNITAEYL